VRVYVCYLKLMFFLIFLIVAVKSFTALTTSLTSKISYECAYLVGMDITPLGTPSLVK